LDAEIKAILEENQKADLQIQTLLEGTIEQQADERQQQRIDAEAQSEGMAEEKLDMYIQQGLKNTNGLNAKTAEKMDAYIQSKWGFIRNIININTFFSNGTAADAASGKKSLLDDVKDEKLNDEARDLSEEFKQNDDDTEEQAEAPKKKRVRHHKVSKKPVVNYRKLKPNGGISYDAEGKMGSAVK